MSKIQGEILIMLKSKLCAKYLKEIDLMIQSVNKLNADFKASETTIKNIEIIDILDVSYKLINNLEEAKRDLISFSKTSREGILIQNEYGKYEIRYSEDGTSFAFSCGFSIELYLDDNWHFGWVKYDPSKGYYFYGDIKINLKEGMLARSNYKAD